MGHRDEDLPDAEFFREVGGRTVQHDARASGFLGDNFDFLKVRPLDEAGSDRFHHRGFNVFGFPGIYGDVRSVRC